MTPAVTPQQPQQPQAAQPQQMTVSDFASKIKAKYPAYKDIPDQELATKVISKYPQYKDQVIMQAQRPESSAQFDQARQQGAYTENSERSGKPVTYLMQKPGENYLDFMKRAAAHGKTVSQEQIKDEALQPKKAARSLARGAEYGVAGGATVAGIGEMGVAGRELLAKSPEAVKAIQEAAKAHPFVADVIKEGLKIVLGGGAAGAVIKALK